MFIPNEISFMYEGKISVLNGEVSSFITCKCRLSGSLPSNVYRTWVFDPRFKIKTGFINNGFSIQFIFKSGHGTFVFSRRRVCSNPGDGCIKKSLKLTTCRKCKS
jgi:hypothetical protein